ncbi:VOC family protein [Microbacterium oleivorans]|uniref:VOC family protein n=1 Tax=Microbacterium oleivorans TaxID=273677 RepID=UPI002041D223|nr:VOC family protein [Microbacterium oleivorans]MCM3694913.1 VOC family protein [Microbacterium oleivorans]
MTLTTTTHLNFRGTAREALEFYARVFDGQAMTTTYADLGMPADAPGADRIVFGILIAADGFRLMAYDVPGQDAGAEAVSGTTTRQNGVTFTDRAFFVSLQGDSLDEVTARWDALAEGATVVEPLAASAWSAGFGMLTDRFGVTWVVDVRVPQPA